MPGKMTRRDWARYAAYKRRRWIRRRFWLQMYDEQGDLYAPEWDLVEAQLIREACEEIGLPMGYGRIGKTPQHLSLDIATPPSLNVDWDSFRGVNPGHEESP